MCGNLYSSIILFYQFGHFLNVAFSYGYYKYATSFELSDQIIRDVRGATGNEYPVEGGESRKAFVPVAEEYFGS